jgi:hypothetical protein
MSKQYHRQELNVARNMKVAIRGIERFVDVIELIVARSMKFTINGMERFAAAIGLILDHLCYLARIWVLTTVGH